MRTKTLKDYCDVLDLAFAEMLQGLDTGEWEHARVHLLECMELVAEIEEKFTPKQLPEDTQ